VLELLLEWIGQYILADSARSQYHRIGVHAFEISFDLNQRVKQIEALKVGDRG